ncbi:hypothetical protein L2E82_14560 [Cichorium intybus]|uniref:Uncharacterized protein n=1 Tax=Cichorium intybus TaxID=13427 RepID=A0ACB9F004_CICIN|nr:hypothetical protein L2E82_14560 [Cichorium intybus]
MKLQIDMLFINFATIDFSFVIMKLLRDIYSIKLWVRLMNRKSYTHCASMIITPVKTNLNFNFITKMPLEIRTRN